jgi:hypothetical protein
MESSAYILMNITSPERIESLNRFLIELRKAKQQRFFPSDDEWQRHVDEKVRSYFWEPTPQELKAWEKEWFSTPVAYRHQMQTVPWSFGSLLEALKHGEFLIVGLQISGEEAKLVFEPLAYPYGGVNSLIAVTEAFGQKVVGFDEGTGFTPYKKLPNKRG